MSDPVQNGVGVGKNENGSVAFPESIYLSALVMYLLRSVPYFYTTNKQI